MRPIQGRKLKLNQQLIDRKLNQMCIDFQYFLLTVANIQVAFEMQVEETASWPTDEWDQPLHEIITENRRIINGLN